LSSYVQTLVQHVRYVENSQSDI